MPAALLLTEYPKAFCDALAQRLELIGPFDQDAAIALPAETRANIRVVITMGTLKAGEALMAALPNLGLISNYGSGHEGTDLAAAARRGIAVTNSPAGNAAAVADMALGLLLAVSRRIVVADKMVREGRWTRTAAERMPLVHGLTGRRLGVYGLGEIGERIARRAAAFEMEIGYHSRKRRSDVDFRYFDSLPGLAAWADVLVLAARADAANRHIIGREVLTALGPDGILINIARGSLVDEAALIDLLETGALGGAGLDVFEREPNVPEALKASDKVVLTPHSAGGTFEAHARLRDMVLANIDAFLAGRPVLNPVTLSSRPAEAKG